MKTNKGEVMKIASGIIVLSLIAIVAGCEPRVDIVEEKTALFETDREFAKTSLEKGAAEAFRMFLAEDAMELSADANPVFGRDSIYQSMLDMPEGALLEWEPEDGEVAQSGELGWTWGNYVFTWKNDKGEEAKSYGKYLNIWVKREDGQWRVLIDMGNKSPAPPDHLIP
jgi:ketosteroid isomerase-like protein